MEKVTWYKSNNGHFYDNEADCKKSDELTAQVDKVFDSLPNFQVSDRDSRLKADLFNYIAEKVQSKIIT